MCPSIEDTILVLHLLYHEWEHVSPKSVHLQFLLLEFIHLEYDSARFDEFLVPESTNYKRYCANPHQQLESLCEARPSSRSFRNLPINSDTLQEQKRSRYPSAEVRFCPLLSIAWDRSRNLFR